MSSVPLGRGKNRGSSEKEKHNIFESLAPGLLILYNVKDMLHESSSSDLCFLLLESGPPSSSKPTALCDDVIVGQLQRRGYDTSLLRRA